MFGFGTVYFYSSVIGQVWYTAHVVATVLTGLFVLASLEARHPILAGLCLGAHPAHAPAHRLLGHLLPLRSVARPRQAGPAAHARRLRRSRRSSLGGAGFAFNWARFGSFGEFGHFYLNVRWTDRIQRYGLTNFAFLARNLSCAFTLTPKLLAKAPFVQLSWHGLSLLITTPALPLSPLAARQIVAAHARCGAWSPPSRC